MNHNLLLILAAGVDIWAALFITQLKQPTSPWEVSLAISEGNRPAITATVEPLQIWLKKDGTMGLWPQTDRAMTLDQLCQPLEAARRAGIDKEIRLLCQPSMEFQDWSPTALRLAEYTEQLRLAPLREGS